MPAKTAHLDGQGHVQSGPLCAWTVRFLLFLVSSAETMQDEGAGLPKPAMSTQRIALFSVGTEWKDFYF